jgi:hypothetical protein
MSISCAGVQTDYANSAAHFVKVSVVESKPDSKRYASGKGPNRGEVLLRVAKAQNSDVLTVL